MRPAPTQALAILRQDARWPSAVEHLRKQLEGRYAEIANEATKASECYRSRRGAMVFDVVYSRQRRYESRVLPQVAKWVESGDPSLARLSGGVDHVRYGMSAEEATTMATVAANLLAFASRDGSSEDSACERWAAGVAPLELTHKLDPVVGGVSGIGPALFAYMRMRCGADTIKPDLRVLRGLRATGLHVPSSNAATVLAHALSAELGIRTCELDKLLWIS